MASRCRIVRAASGVLFGLIVVLSANCVPAGGHAAEAQQQRALLQTSQDPLQQEIASSPDTPAAESQQNSTEYTAAGGEAGSDPCSSLDSLPTDVACELAGTCTSDGRIPWQQVYHCHIKPRGRAVIGLFVTALCIGFLPLILLLLLDSADLYFAPITGMLAQLLHMPPRVAGVTLVAIGNGAPDISSSIAAIRGGQVGLALGLLGGAAMFVHCIASSQVAAITQGLTGKGPAFGPGLVRTVVAYVLGAIVITAFLAAGKFTIVYAVVVLLIYGLFVVSIMSDVWLAALYRWVKRRWAAFKIASRAEGPGGHEDRTPSGRPRLRSLASFKRGSEARTTSGRPLFRTWTFSWESLRSTLLQRRAARRAAATTGRHAGVGGGPGGHDDATHPGGLVRGASESSDMSLSVIEEEGAGGPEDVASRIGSFKRDVPSVAPTHAQAATAPTSQQPPKPSSATPTRMSLGAQLLAARRAAAAASVTPESTDTQRGSSSGAQEGNTHAGIQGRMEAVQVDPQQEGHWSLPPSPSVTQAALTAASTVPVSAPADTTAAATTVAGAESNPSQTPRITSDDIMLAPPPRLPAPTSPPVPEQAQTPQAVSTASQAQPCSASAGSQAAPPAAAPPAAVQHPALATPFGTAAVQAGTVVQMSPIFARASDSAQSGEWAPWQMGSPQARAAAAAAAAATAAATAGAAAAMGGMPPAPGAAATAAAVGGAPASTATPNSVFPVVATAAALTPAAGGTPTVPPTGGSQIPSFPYRPWLSTAPMLPASSTPTPPPAPLAVESSSVDQPPEAAGMRSLVGWRTFYLVALADAADVELPPDILEEIAAEQEAHHRLHAPPLAPMLPTIEPAHSPTGDGSGTPPGARSVGHNSGVLAAALAAASRMSGVPRRTSLGYNSRPVSRTSFELQSLPWPQTNSVGPDSSQAMPGRRLSLPVPDMKGGIQRSVSIGDLDDGRGRYNLNGSSTSGGADRRYANGLSNTSHTGGTNGGYWGSGGGQQQYTTTTGGSHTIDNGALYSRYSLPLPAPNSSSTPDGGHTGHTSHHLHHHTPHHGHGPGGRAVAAAAALASAAEGASRGAVAGRGGSSPWHVPPSAGGAPSSNGTAPVLGRHSSNAGSVLEHFSVRSVLDRLSRPIPVRDDAGILHHGSAAQLRLHGGLGEIELHGPQSTPVSMTAGHTWTAGGAHKLSRFSLGSPLPQKPGPLMPLGPDSSAQQGPASSVSAGEAKVAPAAPELPEGPETGRLAYFLALLIAAGDQITMGELSDWLTEPWYIGIPRVTAFCVSSPVYAAMRATIPTVDPDVYSPFWLVASMCLAPLAVLAYAGGAVEDQTTIYTWPAFGATLGIGVLLGAGTFVLQRRSPDPAVLPTCVVWKVDLVATGYTLVGFVTGVLWIASIANELVNTVGLVAARIGIPEALLGITFLAWGNSMGDFINNTSLAKRGLSSMALTATWAAHIMNLGLSTGIGFILLLSQSNSGIGGVYNLPFSGAVFLGWAMLVVINSAVIVLAVKNEWRLPTRTFVLLARFFYLLFVVLAFVLAFTLK